MPSLHGYRPMGQFTAELCDAVGTGQGTAFSGDLKGLAGQIHRLIDILLLDVHPCQIDEYLRAATAALGAERFEGVLQSPLCCGGLAQPRPESRLAAREGVAGTDDRKAQARVRHRVNQRPDRWQ